MLRWYAVRGWRAVLRWYAVRGWRAVLRWYAVLGWWPGVLAIILALASAIGYGGSDFAAGLASRGVSVIPVILLASVVSAVVVAAALPFAAAPAPRLAALAWGFGAGLAGTLGAFALYLGFRHAAFSVAGPLSAVGSAGFSVLAGLLYGERPTDLALAGIVLALPAIVAVSVSADEGAVTAGDGAVRGVVLGLVAGGCFALLFIGLDQAGSDSGLWPVAAAAVGELAAAVAAAAVAGIAARRMADGGAILADADTSPGDADASREAADASREDANASREDANASRGAADSSRGAASSAGFGTSAADGEGRGFRFPDRRARLLAVATGATGATGTILFFFATHRGFLAVTAVLSSLYPAVTIVLARTVLGERLTAMRLGGLALAGVCVSLIAVGGAS